MVKKLFKHELLSYTRFLIPVYIALLGTATLTRAVQFFETDTAAFIAVMISSIIVFCICVFAATLLTQIVAIVRFYKHLFTSEGYLTFTLPVKVSQHIFVKLASSVIVIMLTSLIVSLSIGITLSSELGLELFKAGMYLFEILVDKIGAHVFFYIIEFAILMVVATTTAMLLFYTCLTLGQLAKKNRVLLAVGIYFGYNFAVQFISSFFSVGFGVLSVTSDVIQTFTNFIDTNPLEFFHIIFITNIVWNAILGVVFYFITHKVMKNKLNLE